MIISGPSSCTYCGGIDLSKLGENVSEKLEVILRQWKVVQRVREKFGCRPCEKTSQAPAPFNIITRGGAEPNLLAMILHAKYAFGVRMIAVAGAASVPPRAP